MRTKCALQLEEARLKWIENQKPSEKGLNIVIADYVELSEYKFIRGVIELNGKLLRYEDDSPSDEAHKVILVNQA